MTEPEHWGYERVLNESSWGSIDWEDLPGMDDEMLVQIAELCQVDAMDPNNCIPCAALVELRSPERGGMAQIDVEDYETIETPKLDALMSEESPFTEFKTPVERFVAQVQTLSDLVQELLEGPPIPPPNVSLEELSLLVVAAQKWISIMDAQGHELAPGPAQVLAATRSLVERLHRG